MYKKDLENLLGNHTPHISTYDCEFGDHYDIYCKCGWNSPPHTYSIDVWISHLIEQVEE